MTASTRRAALGAILGAPLASVPLATAAKAQVAPSDLAQACDWAISHVDWVNHNDEPCEAWPDDRLNGELARVDDVLDRIANEPAQGLDDLRAKARLLLMDWGSTFGSRTLHPGERALMTFLREVASCT